MPFDAMTRTLLECYTKRSPATEDEWYGPWTAILTTLFPPTQGYFVTPHRRPPYDAESHIPGLTIEVVKLSTSLTLRCVLIVKVKNSQHWQAGIGAFERQLNLQTGATFAGTAYAKMYWIGAIGPHWRYGEKEEDGQNPTPLIDWHHTIHDQASFDDLQVLASLVAAL